MDVGDYRYGTVYQKDGIKHEHWSRWANWFCSMVVRKSFLTNFINVYLNHTNVGVGSEDKNKTVMLFRRSFLSVA